MTNSNVRAFTLIELLLSLALMALLFAAMSQLVFSMGELWGNGAQRRLFDRHADAVTMHLQDILFAASGGANGLQPVGVADDTGANNVPALKLEVPEGDRVFRWAGEKPGPVTCRLDAEAGRGLVLSWVSRTTSRSVVSPRRSIVLSPFIKSIAYQYYDRVTGNWFGQDNLQRSGEGRWILPVRLELHFSYGKYAALRTVAIPSTAGGLPTY